MKLKIGRENDALYLLLDAAAIAESEAGQPGVILHFDKHGKVVGVEILGLSTRIETEEDRPA